MKQIFFALITIFTFTSCGTSDSGELLNREWHLEIFEDVAGLPAGAHQVPKDEHYILVLNDTAATGVADCNSFLGNYKLEGDRISISSIAVTEMDCGANSQSAQFLKALSSARKFSIKDGALRIRYEKEKQLVFKRNEQ